jgi:hypothetical protein
MAANEESAESIRTKKLTRKTIFFGGRLEGSRITKRGFWVWFSDKSKKKGGKVQAGRSGLRQSLADKRNVFFPFSSYVGFVPVSEIPSKIFHHPILDENHFTCCPTFFAGQKLLLSLLFFSPQTNFPKRSSILYSRIYLFAILS